MRRRSPDTEVWFAYLAWWHDRYHRDRPSTVVGIPGTAGGVCGRCYGDWEAGTGPHRSGTPEWFEAEHRARRPLDNRGETVYSGR